MSKREKVRLSLTNYKTCLVTCCLTLDDIPESLFRQMTTCQTAANEFLRQFWSSVYPPSTELQTVGLASPAQKATKAAKMISYITKTQEKVEALIQTARNEGVDTVPIETVRGVFPRPSTINSSACIGYETHSECSQSSTRLLQK